MVKVFLLNDTRREHKHRGLCQDSNPHLADAIRTLKSNALHQCDPIWNCRYSQWNILGVKRFEKVSETNKNRLWFLVTGRFQNRCGNVFSFGNIFFLPASDLHDIWYTWLLELDQIFHTQSMVAKRGRTNQANVHTPL